MAECKVCKETDVKNFYKSNLGTCKECVKARVKKHRAENIEKIREYDRNRPNAEERVKKNSERIELYKELNHKKYNDYTKAKSEWGKRNRKKRNAQQQAERAVFKGKIKRADACERCKATKNLHGHHHDYSKPLEVIWLCPKCHGKEHKKINDEKRKSKGN